MYSFTLNMWSTFFLIAFYITGKFLVLGINIYKTGMKEDLFSRNYYMYYWQQKKSVSDTWIHCCVFLPCLHSGITFVTSHWKEDLLLKNLNTLYTDNTLLPIGKYLAIFSFCGLMMTKKYCENWKTAKIIAYTVFPLRIDLNLEERLKIITVICFLWKCTHSPIDSDQPAFFPSCSR